MPSDRAHDAFVWVSADGRAASVAKEWATAAAVARFLADGRPGGFGPAAVTRAEAELYCRRIATPRASYRLPTAAELQRLAGHHDGRQGDPSNVGSPPAEWSAEAAEDGVRRPFRVVAVPR